MNRIKIKLIKSLQNVQISVENKNLDQLSKFSIFQIDIYLENLNAFSYFTESSEKYNSRTLC